MIDQEIVDTFFNASSLHWKKTTKEDDESQNGDETTDEDIAIADKETLNDPSYDTEDEITEQPIQQRQPSFFKRTNTTELLAFFGLLSL